MLDNGEDGRDGSQKVESVVRGGGNGPRKSYRLCMMDFEPSSDYSGILR